MVRDRLATVFPEDRIMGEEEGGTWEGAGRVWIVDPIDGTANFARAIPIWATLIALQVDGEIVLGVANAPALGERYAAVRGGGATMNGKHIEVSGIGRMGDAQFLYSQLDTLLASTRNQAVVGLVVDSARERGFGDYWGHLLVARGAAENLPRAVARDLGLRGARADRRRGRRARHELRGWAAVTQRPRAAARTACSTTRCCAGSPTADAPPSPDEVAGVAGVGQDLVGSRHVLDADAGQVADRQLGRRGPARRPAGADRAELHRAVRGVERMLQLPEPPALVERVDREDIGTPQQLGIELPLARAVGPHRGDVRAGRDPLGTHQGFGRRRAGDDDIGALDRFLGRTSDASRRRRGRRRRRGPLSDPRRGRR